MSPPSSGGTSYLGALGASGIGYTMAASITLVPILLYPLYRMAFPTIDPREPPILHPRLPIVGHLISLIREYTTMFERLYKERGMPICTLPMLNEYIYVINKPALIAAAMRNRILDFDPFTLRFAAAIMGMTKEHVELFERPGGMAEVNRIFHGSLAGDNIGPMNDRALGDMAVVLNGIKVPGGLDVADPFIWLRGLLSMASMKGMFGKNNPFTYEDIETIWEFEKGVGLLALGVAPDWLAPNAVAARKRGQAKMTPFYLKHLDQGDDVCALMKDRAALNRRLGIPDDEIAIIEYSMLFVATTNTAPTLFWLFVHVFADPDLLSRIRAEVEAVTTVEADGGRRTSATIHVPRLDKDCPTLFASYREALRLYSDQLGNRRVMADTTLRDPDTGREYLLKEGINVQWPGKVAHRLPSIWGENATEFRYERFLDTPSAEEEKKRRGAMIPFGGGKHLCPGRNFAMAEILGFIGALALGFEAEGARVPASADPYLGTAVRRPDWGDSGSGVRMMRREGWEDVTWSFECVVRGEKSTEHAL